MDPELGGDGAHPPMFDEVVAQDLRLEFVVDRHRARRSAPDASASSYRRAPPLPAAELADRARAEVAVHLGSGARCASSLGGWFGQHRRIRLAHHNLMTGEFSTARGAIGTVMRHFLHTRVFAAPAPVAALALGVTVPAASRVLIPASRRAQRFTPSGAAATCPAVLLAPVAARADEHLAPASGTQKQSGIVHCTPRRGGLDDPRLPGNTALGAVRKCGSGRSLGRDHQVSTVRGCVSLLVDSDLTPTHERRHRRCARCACAMGRQHRLRRETTTRPKRARRDDSEQVRSDRSSQFTWPVRQITAHLRSHQQTDDTVERNELFHGRPTSFASWSMRRIARSAGERHRHEFGEVWSGQVSVIAPSGGSLRTRRSPPASRAANQCIALTRARARARSCASIRV